MNDTHPIARFVQGFFHEYLAAQRGLSNNTIYSYRDSLKLFLRFVSQRVGKHVDKLNLEHFDEKLVTLFLNDLEETRGNSTLMQRDLLSKVVFPNRHRDRRRDGFKQGFKQNSLNIKTTPPVPVSAVASASTRRGYRWGGASQC